jgi:hypothetical protein
MEEVKKDIEVLETNPASLSTIFEKAFADLDDIVSNKPHYKADLDAALKSATLDGDIDKMLHAGP